MEGDGTSKSTVFHPSKPTIVRFHGRKIVDLIHKNKHKLKNLATLNLEIAGLNTDSRIYIHASQCQYQKNLSYNCRLLKRASLISKAAITDDGKTTFLGLDGKWVKVLHESELMDRFPTFQDFTFDVVESITPIIGS